MQNWCKQLKTHCGWLEENLLHQFWTWSRVPQRRCEDSWVCAKCFEERKHPNILNFIIKVLTCPLPNFCYWIGNFLRSLCARLSLKTQFWVPTVWHYKYPGEALGRQGIVSQTLLQITISLDFHLSLVGEICCVSLFYDTSSSWQPSGWHNVLTYSPTFCHLASEVMSEYRAAVQFLFSPYMHRPRIQLDSTTQSCRRMGWSLPRVAAFDWNAI